MTVVVSRLSPQNGYAIPQRIAVCALAGIALIASFIEFLPGAGPVSATIRLAVATLAVGILPGAAVMLLARPRPWQRLHHVLALAVGLSLVASQIGVFAAVLLHIPASIVSKAILGTALVMAIVALLQARKPGAGGLIVERDDLIVATVLVVYAAILFLRGSPVLSDEDQTHIGIIGRLAALSRPALDNVYYAPGAIYTHPFPAISFLQSLIACVSNLDPIFVYHKLRSFFGAAAVLMVYAGARQVFVNRTLALVALLAASVLALAGRFADFGDYFWAQLATYSHPSDVAMNVAMPAALVALFAYFQSWNRRASRIYLAIAIATSAMLAVTHVREAVQLTVYAASFGVALLLVRPHRWRAHLIKAGIAVAVLLLAMVGYTEFHQATVHAVASNEAMHRGALRNIVETAPWSSLFSGMLPGYLLGWPTVFYGWIPVAIAIAPAVLLAYRRRPLVLLMAASLFTYLLLIRFPLFSIPFVYLTYSEILMVPARNLTYFAYILTGVGFYWAAIGLTRLRTWSAIVLAVGGFAVVSYLARQKLESELLDHIDWFYLPVILALAAALLTVAWRRPAPYAAPGSALGASRIGLVPAAALLLIVAAAITFDRAAAPLSITTMRRQSDAFPVVALPISSPDGLISGLSCVQHADQPIGVRVPLPTQTVKNVTACPPTVELAAFLRDNVGTNAVIAANTLNAFPLSAFAPVQIAAWPITTTYNLIDPKSIAPKYYERLAKSLEREVQPFFNAFETPEERTSFTDDLGITHVVVDPMFHDILMPILSQSPYYALQFDQGGWAIFSLVRSDRQ